MPTRQPRANAFLRFLGYAVFVLFALSAALICLWLAFPRWGMNPNQVYFFYVAPQGYAVALTLALAGILDIVVALVGGILALARGQAAWALTFLGAAFVSVQAPITIAMGNADYRSVSLSAQAQMAIGIASAAAFLLLPVLALIYARRRPATHINGIS